MRAEGRDFGGAITCGENLIISVDVEVPAGGADVKLGIGIADSERRRLITAHPECDPGFHHGRCEGRVRLTCKLERPGLVEGRYSLSFLLMVDGKLEQKLEHCMVLEIAPGDFFGNAGKHFTGTFLVDQTWAAEPVASPTALLGA